MHKASEPNSLSKSRVLWEIFSCKELAHLSNPGFVAGRAVQVHKAKPVIDCYLKAIPCNNAKNAVDECHFRRELLKHDAAHLWRWHFSPWIFLCYAKTCKNLKHNWNTSGKQNGIEQNNAKNHQPNNQQNKIRHYLNSGQSQSLKVRMFQSRMLPNLWIGICRDQKNRIIKPEVIVRIEHLYQPWFFSGFKSKNRGSKQELIQVKKPQS